MKINKKITTLNLTHINSLSRISYIVIHYVGAVSTAKNNADYFYDTYAAASAHYFVDENEIWQVVEDYDIAWHVGATSYKHPNCRNENSLGIEMCCKKDSSGAWYFEDKTVENTLWLVKSLMKKYSVPVSNVLRHYDVTGKNCPTPYVLNTTKWERFLAKLTPPSVLDVTNELSWRGIILNQPLWNEAAKQDEDIRYLFENYYPYILENGGSIKEPFSVKNEDEAIDILQRQGILREISKWKEKAKADKNVFHLLLKIADYIN